MVLYRNIRGRDLLEIFLVAAASGVLLVRFYLHMTGYPQLGGGSFHIAHMLWGGLLMVAGLVLALAYLGARAHRLAALIGGLGFGIFIDEIGKFITKDNDYFFQPAVGIIYAIFVVLYLIFTYLTRDDRMSSREYQLNALAELEEALSHDMDDAEKIHAQAILDHADQRSPITIELKKLIQGLETVPNPPKSRATRLLESIDRLYKNFWQMRESNSLVRIFFMAEIMVVVLGILFTLASNLDDVAVFIRGHADYGVWTLVGEVGAASVAVALAIQGVLVLSRSRLEAFELFRLATLINLFLAGFFRFSRMEFAALPAFLLNLMLIILISYVLQQERRLSKKV